MSGRLAGKVAIISGAARGQGEAEARRFAAEGAAVLIGDLRDELGAAVARSVGSAVRYVHLDVTRPDDWAHAVAACIESFGPPTILVNNAGIITTAALEDIDVDEARHLLDTNLFGALLGHAGGGAVDGRSRRWVDRQRRVDQRDARHRPAPRSTRRASSPCAG